MIDVCFYQHIMFYDNVCTPLCIGCTQNCIKCDAVKCMECRPDYKLDINGRKGGISACVRGDESTGG